MATNAKAGWTRLTMGVAGALSIIFALAAEPPKPVPWSVRCADELARDQDDMCIWVHPTDASQSTVIASDKAAGKIFVYDLAGKTIQSLSAKHPGNIDVRYGFPLDKEKPDIVAFNQRDGNKVLVYRVDATTRRLERVDDDAIATGENYGGCLYRSLKSGKFYFITTSYSGRVEQYELSDNGKGRVRGKKVRSWKIGLCEAAVGDDRTGKIYIGEERKGVWEIGGEPDDPTPGKLVAKVGENGLTGDVEGLAIYYLANDEGYLLVSNQGSNNFKVYRREGSHEFVGTFAIRGARDTDGIDVCNVNLGTRFPSGLFACHTDGEKCPVLLVRWEDIAESLSPKLQINTSWDPRK